ncbi:hypothetical protein N0B51_09415 [Tsuneonella sp. YG55]|uniref:Uncharacterized protein n=1 Tax=Tsuneonella litorea TaxID=2976475 RepID=A0A9X3A887_9SPHN|nr:hypothetical protein [Tsuneonella litorea]MCT2559201.1 hypothetical protein [Tsuneonella litorea]
MKKFALPALAAALALAACDSTPETGEAGADVTADGAATTADGDTTVVVPGPTATETTVVGAPADTSDKVSIGPDGIKADVGDADTRVQVDTSGKTVTVKD